MATYVKYRHGPLTGQVHRVEDDLYAESLLTTGYAERAEAPPEPPPTPEDPTTPRGVRRKELEKLPAAEVKDLAVSYGAEGRTKAEAIEDVLAVEFPGSA